MYIPGMAQQTRVFLLSVGFGFVLGLVYDLICAVRKAVSQKKRAVFAQDLAFGAAATVLIFFFLLCVNYGEFRAYPLFGMPPGFAVYAFTLGSFVRRICDKIAAVIYKFLQKIKKSAKKVKKHPKLLKKSKINAQKPLQNP